MNITADQAAISPERRLLSARENAQMVSRAKLRAQRQRRPTQLHHPVRLGGLHDSPNFVGTDDFAPLFVERKDQNFVAGLLADVAASEVTAKQRVFSSPPRRENGILRLYQPVQRVRTLAVFEAFCDVPGTPRLDRARIESSGMVVRRIGKNGTKEAWIKGGTAIFGWDVIDEEIDPEADKRVSPVSVGHPHIDALLPSYKVALRAQAQRLATVLGPDVAVTESVSPLFTTPPEVCLATGRTILFAAIPVTSSEQAETLPEAPRYGDDAQERMLLQGHLVPYLAAGGRKSFGGENLVLDASWAKLAIDAAAAGVTAAPASIKDFMLLLQQLHVEFDAFGDSAASKALFSQLNSLRVERTQANGELKGEPAGDFLIQAKAILLDSEANTAQLKMPASWGEISNTQAKAVFEATLRCLDARYLAIRPAQGRFDDPAAQYVTRAFIRLKPEHSGCPSQLIWSPYSEPFTIAPWYESAGAPPQLIQMPDLFDRETLKKLKPNVAFAMPPKLAKLLQSDAKQLRDGNASESGWTLGWICSFSLPIITLCAFIVLNIFLSLFALIFFWLPFLKICIPYPKKK